MIYSEYKLASTRHLETSLFMLEFLDEVKDLDERKNILCNIYYLAGYTIECIVSYAIYNYIGFRKSDDVRSLDPFAYRFDIGFYREYSLSARPAIRPRFNIASHNFQNNCMFFAAQGIAEASKVPHFGGPITDTSLIPLFNRWRPDARYLPSQFREHDIIKFVKLSKEIHDKTRQYLTKD